MTGRDQLFEKLSSSVFILFLFTSANLQRGVASRFSMIYLIQSAHENARNGRLKILESFYLRSVFIFLFHFISFQFI